MLAFIIHTMVEFFITVFLFAVFACLFYAMYELFKAFMD